MVYNTNHSLLETTQQALLSPFSTSLQLHCACCHLPSLGHGFLCECCEDELQANVHKCSQCAEPFNSHIALNNTYTCGQCLQQPPFFQQAFCPMVYNDAIKPVIEKIKSNDIAAIKYAARLFSQLSPMLLQHDVWVAIPMSADKLLSRHSNPSQLLSQEMMKFVSGYQAKTAHGFHHSPQQAYLRQIKSYPAQKGLNLKQRKKNVRGAFTAEKGSVQAFEGRSVLIIDDVMTTGSTLNEAAKVIHKLGAKSISVAAVARTPKLLH